MRNLQYLRDLIATNRNEEAINELIKLSGENPAIKNHLDAVRAQHNKYQSKDLLGLVSTQDAQIGDSTVTYRMLKIVSYLEGRQQSSTRRQT